MIESMPLVESLTEYWKQAQTKKLAKAFEAYMLSIGARKYDRKRADNSNTYSIDGKSMNWNKVRCSYHKDSTTYCEENLMIVLRKQAGNYLIIQRGGTRAFEVDSGGEKHLEEASLNDIMTEHKALFDILLGK